MLRKGMKVTGSFLGEVFRVIFRKINNASNHNLNRLTSGQFVVYNEHYDNFAKYDGKVYTDMVSVFGEQYFDTTEIPFHDLAGTTGTITIMEWYENDLAQLS